MPSGFALVRRCLPALLAGMVCASLAGCGSSGTYPVKGILVYEDNDQPVTELKGFTVTFDSAALAKSAVGDIQEDGTFQLYTTTPGDGAYPGEYKVTVSQPRPRPERPVTARPVIDPMYEDPHTSPLKETVEKKSNDFKIKLKRIKGKG